MEWMLRPLKHYAVFSGRARPKEYWMFFLLVLILFIAATFVDTSLGFSSGRRWASAGGGQAWAGFDNNGGPVTLIVWLALLIPSLAVAVRRLHDTDRSGWWILINLLPFIGWVVFLVFMVMGGTRGSNRFGPDPLDEPAAPAMS